MVRSKVMQMIGGLGTFIKYQKKRSLVISKCGAPFKSTAADINGGQKILANGNFYILDVDTERVSPYYIKTFLDRGTGMKLLDSIARGGRFQIISPNARRRMPIPLVEAEKRKDTAWKYQAVLRKLQELKKEEAS